MPTLGKIIQALFNNQQLSNVLALQIRRSCQIAPAGEAGKPFATSLQPQQPTVRAELTLRDLPAIDTLELGASGRLEITVAPTQDQQPARRIVIDAAVLIDEELQFAQDRLAGARLVFVGESSSGANDPFAASEVTS